MPRPPPGLLRSARDDAAFRAVLGDLYEDRDQPHWAAWVRAEASGGARLRLLERALRTLGMRIKPIERPWFGLEHRFDQPFLHTLAWTIRSPSRARALLETPAFTALTRLHLASRRPRTAVPRALAAIVAHTRDLVHVDLHDVALPLGPLTTLPELRSLGMRLHPGGAAVLPVTHLRIRARSAAELAAWREIETPDLKRLEIVLLDGAPKGDRMPLDALDAALDRPCEVLAAHRSLYGAYPTRFDRVPAQRRIPLPTRPRWPPEPTPTPWSVVD